MPTDINSFHNVFDQAVSTGFANIQSDVSWLFNIMIVLTIALTALLTWIWGDWDGLIRSLIQRILLIGFIGYLITNWHSLTMLVVTGMTQLGLKAGGTGMSAQTLWDDPSQIWMDGINLSNKVAAVCNSCGYLTDLKDMLYYFVGSICVLIAFAVLAITVFIATLEFKLVTLASMVFVPFAIWQKTTFLSDRALAYVFSFGAKLLVLALIISVGEHTLTQLTVSPTPQIDNLATLCFFCFTLMILALSAPKLAAALISGGPQLGASAAIVPATMLAGAALTAGAGAAVLGRQSVSQYRAATTAMNTSAAGGGSRSDILMAGARGFFNPASVGGDSARSAPRTNASPASSAKGSTGNGNSSTGGSANKSGGDNPTGGGGSPPPSNDGGGATASTEAGPGAAPDSVGSSSASASSGAGPSPSATANPQTSSSTTSGEQPPAASSSPAAPAPARKRQFTTGGKVLGSAANSTVNAFRQAIPEEGGGSIGAPDIHRKED
jgi:type IV secretion system protein TrbL